MCSGRVCSYIYHELKIHKKTVLGHDISTVVSPWYVWFCAPSKKISKLILEIKNIFECIFEWNNRASCHWPLYIQPLAV